MKKWFEKKLVLLICLSLAVNPVTVFAAEPADVPMLPETTRTPDVQMLPETVNEMPQEENEIPDTVQETQTLTKEEIREILGAESAENITDEALSDSEALKAGTQERKAYEEDVRSFEYDDSGKTEEDNKGTEDTVSADGEESAGFWPFDSTPVSDKFDFTVNGTRYNDTLEAAVKKASDTGKPVYVDKNNVKKTIEVNSTVDIPEGKRVEIHLNGISLAGSSKLGNNEIFSVKEDATLRMFGTDDGSEGAAFTNAGDGAVIAQDRSVVEFNNLIFNGNHAGRNGGALYLQGKVTCRLNNVLFRNNKAGNCGGAIYINGHETNVYLDANTGFVLNKAEGNGGAIYIDGSQANLYGPAAGKTVFMGNHADGYGGAIFFNKSDFLACSFDLKDNSSKKDGGAMYLNSKKGSITNCVFSENAGREGGAVYVYGAYNVLSNVEIKDNHCDADGYGAGIYVDSYYNLGTGGRVNVTGNHRGNGEVSDVFLENGNATQAYLKAASYARGTKIGMDFTKYKEGLQVSLGAGNYDPSVFFCNKNGWYIAQDQNKSSALYRKLILTADKTTAHDAEFEILGDRKNAKKKTAQAGAYRTATGQTYDLVYGFASSPSHTDGERDIVNKYFYSDGYFFDDPKVYNPHLATFGMNLAMASADSNISGHDDYSYKFDNVKSVLCGIGCDEDSIWISPSYTVKPTDSSIGVAIGKKKMTSQADKRNYYLIPIAIRSYGYEKEWASNMTINGDNTSAGHEHSGFRDARTKVMTALKDYIAKNSLESVVNDGRAIFFVTGFSRGSATANLTGAALIDTYGENSSLKKTNKVFAYCFAVPQGGTDADDSAVKGNASSYYSIHNIINKVDLTPMVAPEQMGFKRYGVDHFVPGDTAGTVKRTVKNASAANGGGRITTYYDNSAYLTNSSAYAEKRPAMLKQLMLINDEIHFVDYFKEADIDVSLSQAIGQAIIDKLSLKEAEYVKVNELANSTKTLEEWLPDFYETIQSYHSLSAEKSLTRDDFSKVVVKAGKKTPAKNEKNWYEKGATAQDTFRGLVMLMLSKTPAEKDDLGFAFSGLSTKLGIMEMKGVYSDLLNNSKGWDQGEDTQQKYLDMFWNKLNDNKYGKKGIQDAITDRSEYAALESYYPSLMSLVLRLVGQDFNDSDHKGHIRTFGTFANNSEAILQGHVPEIALAWLRVNDDYYNAENKAYAWKEESGAAATAISLNGVDTENDNTGSCSGTLSCSDESAEIYYTVTKGGVTSQPALYQKGDAIAFDAPKTGTATYTVNTWIYRSRAAGDKKVYWSRYLGQEGKDEKSFTVSVKAEQLKTVTVNYKKTDSGSVETYKTLKVRSGDTVKINKNDIAPQLGGDWYFTKYLVGGNVYSNEILSLPVTDDMTVTAVFMPKIKEIAFDGSYYTDVLQPVEGQNLEKKIQKDKIFYKLADGTDRKGYSGETMSLNWNIIGDDGSWQHAEDSVARSNTKYVLRLKITGDTFGIPIADSVTAFDPFDGSSSVLEKNLGCVRPEINFAKTAETSKKITGCTAGDLTVSVNMKGAASFEEKADRIGEALPATPATIKGSDGVTLSGCAVSWKREDITQEKIDHGEFDLIGDVTDVGALRLFNTDEYSWAEWKSSNPGLTEFQVKIHIETVSAGKLAAPTAGLPSGSYTAGKDPLPLNEEGRVLVTLNDPNGNAGEGKIRYTLKKDGTPVEGCVDAEYSESIALPKVSEGAFATFVLSADIVTQDPEYENSDIAEWTYVIHGTPAKHTLKFFVDDYNDPMTMDEIRAMEEGEYDSFTLAAGDEICLDAASAIEKAGFRGALRIVSWNEVRDAVPGSDIPGSSDDSLWYTMPDTDVYVRAMTAPVLESVEIGIAEPVTGAELADIPYYVSMELGGEQYDIDPDTWDVFWTVSDDMALASGTAKKDTEYTAFVTVSAGGLYEIFEDDEDTLKRKLDMHFFADDDLKIYVLSENGIDRTEVSDNIILRDEKGFADTLVFAKGYEKTGNAYFIGVKDPERLTVSWNGNKRGRYDDLIKPNLPENINVYVMDDSINSLPVSWNIVKEESPEGTVKEGIAYDEAGYVYTKEDIDGMDDLSLVFIGYCVIPEDLLYFEDDPYIEEIKDDDGRIKEVRYYFEYPVTLEGAPISNMPDITPLSDEFEEDQDVIADFDTTTVSSSANKVSVYYKITPIPAGDDEDEYYDTLPCWYDEDWNIEKDPDAHILSENGADMEFRRIAGADFAKTGARVTAIAVEDGCRMSEPAFEEYIFHSLPAADVPDEVYDALADLAIPVGDNLRSLVAKLPAGCSFDEYEDLDVSRQGKAGDLIYTTVIYNPDPSAYRNSYIDVAVELTAGVHNIIVQGGTAYLVDRESKTQTAVTKAPATGMIVLSADAAPAGTVFDRWAVYCETGDEVELTENDADKSMVSFEMPEGEVFAKAFFVDENVPVNDPVKSITLDNAVLDMVKGDEVVLSANVVYDKNAASKPEPQFICADGNILSVVNNGNSARIKALASGRTVVWAVCGQKTACCIVTVGKEKLYFEIENGYLTLSDGSRQSHGTVTRGETVTLTANEPKNEAWKFKEWLIHGADIDTKKSSLKIFVTDNILARAEYEEADEYKDPGEYGQKDIKIKSLRLTDAVKGKSIKNITLPQDGTISVNAKAVYKKDQTVKPSIVFRSSNTDVVKVKTVSVNEGEAVGVIVGNAVGTAYVTAYCGNKTAKVKVTVEGKDIKGVFLSSWRMDTGMTDDGQYILELGSGEQECVTVNPDPLDSFSQMKVSWKSDDTKVATVKNGIITAKASDRAATTIRVSVKSRACGSKKWVKHDPVYITVRVKASKPYKKVRMDKRYSLGLKASQVLDLDAERIGKKGVLSENTVELKVKGSRPESIKWESTNEDVVKVIPSDGDLYAKVSAVGTGTAYVTVTGSDPAAPNVINRSVMKVTVKSTCPEITFEADSEGLLSDDGKTLTINRGSCDRIYYRIAAGSEAFPMNVTQAPIWSAKGGVTVNDGVICANNTTKAGKPAKVTLKCGKAKAVLEVTVR